jgi:hypothetical protein
MQQLFCKKFLKPPFCFLGLLLFVMNSSVWAVEAVISVKLNWSVIPSYYTNGVTYSPFYTFENAGMNYVKSKALPVFVQNIPLTGAQNVTVSIKNEKSEEIGITQPFQDKKEIGTEFSVTYTIGYIQKRPYAIVQVIPVRQNNGKIEKLTQFELVVNSAGSFSNAGTFQKKAFAQNSILSQGSWLKMNISQTGVYSINKQYLIDAGINIDALDPRTIKIYGNGAGMLPQECSVARIDDLAENAIVVEGESDGVFNDNDRILFYARAQKDVWKYNAQTSRYEHQTNIYSDITSYFITYGGITGKRIENAAPVGTANVQVNQFDRLYVHEVEKSNLIKSGRRWFGEEFNRVNTYSFQVDMGSVKTSEPMYVRSSVAAHSYAPSTFRLTVNNGVVINHSMPSVVADFELPYASDADNNTTLAVSNGIVNVKYDYISQVLGSIGWLDYFELQTRNTLAQNNPQFTFRDARSVDPLNIAEYTISAGVGLNIWDVTIPGSIKKCAVSFNGTSNKFTCLADTLREFISFDGSSFITPPAPVKVSNQNLHGLPAADLFIVTHPQFLSEAQTLASFHENKSGLRVNVVTTSQIYNEFSSGVQDLTAIRDFMRMFYKRAASPQDLPKYLTLFGRASYDFKSRIADNTNYVPTYESVESFNPVGSYNSDDFLGLLDDNEGIWDTPEDLQNWGNKEEFLDIAIGRLPAQNNSQAQIMINKIMDYVNNPVYSDWKTKLVFVADDEDGNIHQNQADIMANNAITNFKNYNVKKIFSDAFKEENTSGGARNPLAQQEIVNSVQQGAMIINYTGHGGEIGWASERILNTDDIQRWTNGGKLPLFVTATCEFSRFDDPSRTSAGEMVLLNANGGGIALFTTVRLVSSGSNFALNTFFYNNIGLDSASAFNKKRLGEILRLTKNNYSWNDKNERNFTLLGDPAIYLAYPVNRVQTTAINTQNISQIPDTLKAFAKVTITGRVVDLYNNPVANYNGVVYPTVYDKRSLYKTVGNNAGSPPATFSMQNNVIYRGKASVINGVFSFTFVVPKDISYEIGYGKISYAADNGTTDAIGNFQNIIVGGTADSILTDNNGPEIKLFLNDEKFVYGGITSENPLLIIKLKDANGINITGRGVGRDIAMVVNNDVTKNTSLNEYYQAKIDSYQEGEVRYPMKDMPQGKNMLKTRAYDIYNNSSDAMLEFVVATSAEVALQHVLNYPNPFTTNTTFHFDHNKAGEAITVQVQIFTITGKLIKTLQTETATTGSHFDQLSWDGRDDYGDNIGKGAYIYRVKVKSQSGKSAEQLQKLVILN